MKPNQHFFTKKLNRQFSFSEKNKTNENFFPEKNKPTFFSKKKQTKPVKFSGNFLKKTKPEKNLKKKPTMPTLALVNHVENDVSITNAGKYCLCINKWGLISKIFNIVGP